MKNNYKMKVDVKKLFNIKDILLDFDNQLNIVVGENGCGKTILLKIINNIINNDFISISKIPFESIELNINDNIFLLKNEDIVALKEYQHPEFRFIVREALLRTNNIDEYYNYIFDKLNNLNSYSSKFYDDDYCYNYKKFLLDDLKIYQLKDINIEKIQKLILDGKFSKCVYGSKIYLRQIYNLYHGLSPKIANFTKVNKSYYYSFIDLDDKYYQFKNITFINKKRILKELTKKFINMDSKKIKFVGNNIELYNKTTNQKIERLSSGEKKTIQLYKALHNLNKNTIIFLDEPELSMSFIWKKELIYILKRFAKKSKIIIASQQILIEDEKDLSLMVPIISR